MPLQNISPPEGKKKKEALLKRKLISPVFNFLKQGITPKKLALAFTFGILISIFPVFGVTTLICLLAVFLFRINVGAIMLANYFAYPLQFIFYLPLIRTGEIIYGVPPMPFSISEIVDMFTNDILSAIDVLWWSSLYAITAWFVICLPSGLLLYYLIKFILDKLTVRIILQQKQANNKIS